MTDGMARLHRATCASLVASHDMSRVAALLLLAVSARGVAQDYERRAHYENATLIGINALIGGTTAAVHAWVAGKDVSKAFSVGTLGGLVHLGGKALMARTSTPILGLPVSAVGVSMVANAGAGHGAFDEIGVPLGFMTLRVRPHRGRKVAATINLVDAFAVASVAMRAEVDFDTRQSLRLGAFVFRSPRHLMRLDGDTISGLAAGPVIVLSELHRDRAGLTRHEMTHVYQYWFEQGAVGQPVERAVRRHVGPLRRLPSWLELGLVAPGLEMGDHALFGRQGLHALTQDEATIFERP